MHVPHLWASASKLPSDLRRSTDLPNKAMKGICHSVMVRLTARKDLTEEEKSPLKEAHDKLLRSGLAGPVDTNVKQELSSRRA
jgi:hypothetical protein